MEKTIVPVILINHLGIFEPDEEEKDDVNDIFESIRDVIQDDIVGNISSVREAYFSTKDYVSNYINSFNTDKYNKNYMWLDNSDFIVLSEDTNIKSFDERYIRPLSNILNKMKSQNMVKCPIMLFDISIFPRSAPMAIVYV